MNLVRLQVFDFHTRLTENQLAPPGFLVLERMLVRLPVQPRDDGPILPDGLRGRLDVPVPGGGPAVPAAACRADRGGTLRDVRLAGLLLLGDQAILVRPGADPGRAVAGGRAGIAGRDGGAGCPWPRRRWTARSARCSWASSARSASGSPIRWRWCSRRWGAYLLAVASIRRDARRRASDWSRWDWHGWPASASATWSRTGSSARTGSSGTGGISPSCGCRRGRWPS